MITGAAERIQEVSTILNQKTIVLVIPAVDPLVHVHHIGVKILAVVQSWRTMLKDKLRETNMEEISKHFQVRSGCMAHCHPSCIN